MVKNGGVKHSIRQIPGGKKLNPQIPSTNLDCVAGQVGNSTVVVGGTSNCREGDLQPLLIHDSAVVRTVELGDCSKNGAGAIKVDVGNVRSSAALKVFAEMSETAPEPNQAADLLPHNSDQKVTEIGSDFKTHLMPQIANLPVGSKMTFADIVTNKRDQKNCEPRVETAANKFAQQRSFHDGTLESFGQIREIDGQQTILFSAAEIEELTAPFEFTLIGKFSHGFPSMKTLKLKLAEFNLKSDFAVSLLEYKHVLLHLSCEEDYTRLFCRQVLYLAGFPMRIFKWTPNFVPQEEAPFAPVWVRFPYLPVHLFDRRSLFIIASSIGKPLRIDSATADLTRPSTPRVCIELELTKPLPVKVPIILNGHKMFQAVEYEMMPKFCTYCKHLGHDINACLKLNQPTVTVQPASKMCADEQQPNSEVRNPLSVKDQAQNEVRNPLSVKVQAQQSVKNNVQNSSAVFETAQVPPVPPNTSAPNLNFQEQAVSSSVSKSLIEQIPNAGPFLSDEVTESDAMNGEKISGETSQPINQVSENVEKEQGRSGTDDEFYSDIEGVENNSFSEGEEKERLIKERDRIFKPSQGRFKKPPRDNCVNLVFSTNKKKHKVQKNPV